MADYTHIRQPFEPIYDEQSKILILGSLPSVKSRENGFYYGNPQNRFWKVLAAVLGTSVPESIEQKRQMLLEHHIALWDVIEECDIIGSSDSSIKNVVVADVESVIRDSDVDYIYVNGKTAEKYYQKYLYDKLHIEAVALPSTSPANAAFSLERLIDKWKKTIVMQQGEYQFDFDISYQQYVKILHEAHVSYERPEEYSFVWRRLFGSTASAKQSVKVWYQVYLDGTENVLMTLGNLYDDIIDQFESEDALLRGLMADIFAMGVLKMAYSAFFDANRLETGYSANELRFLEEDEMSIVPDLIRKLKIKDVKMNEAGMLIPQKTVAFSTKTGSLFKECAHTGEISICKSCSNFDCPNRDKGLRIEAPDYEDIVFDEAKKSDKSEKIAAIIADRKCKEEKIADDIKRKTGNFSYGFQRMMKKDE